MAKLAVALLWILALALVPVHVLSMGDWTDWNMQDEDEEDEEVQRWGEDEEEVQHLGVPLTVAQLSRLFKNFDANKDGKATAQEIMAFARQMSSAIALQGATSIVDDIDTDNDIDGKLSLAEYLSSFVVEDGNKDEMKEFEKTKVKEKAKFQAADENDDGFLTYAEASGLYFPEVSAKVLNISVQDTMDMKDSDGDGMLTPKEFYQFEGGANKFTEDQDELLLFHKLDQDGNGLLNAAEVTPWVSGTLNTEVAVLKLMEIADKNGDMAATFEELKNARVGLAASDAHDHLIQWVEHQDL